VGTSFPGEYNIDVAKMQAALSYLESMSFEDGINEVIIARRGKEIYHGDSIQKKHKI